MPTNPEEDTAPAIFEGIELTLPEDLPSNATLNQARHADVTIANSALSWCYHAASRATSISSICKVIQTTMGVVESRRKLLCLPYGYSDKDSAGALTAPLDD